MIEAVFLEVGRLGVILQFQFRLGVIEEIFFQFTALTEQNDVIDERLQVFIAQPAKGRHRSSFRPVFNRSLQIRPSRFIATGSRSELEDPTAVVARFRVQIGRRRSIPITTSTVARQTILFIDTLSMPQSVAVDNVLAGDHFVRRGFPGRLLFFFHFLREHSPRGGSSTVECGQVVLEFGRCLLGQLRHLFLVDEGGSRSRVTASQGSAPQQPQ